MATTHTVFTPVGKIRGAMRRMEDGETVVEFRGIPYVLQQPTGENRFKPGVPLNRLPRGGVDDVYDATQFKNAAIQRSPAENLSILGEGVRTGEDCLWLNIWTPLDKLNPVQISENLPVFVFIHGGAFQQGTASEEQFNGANLSATQKIVVVTLNYRLGILGFLYLPGAVEENLGMKDQQLALYWVHKYIACFGGDADNITLCGESVGATSVAYHLLKPNPFSEIAFKQAILMSGSLLGFFGFRRDTEVCYQESKDFILENGGSEELLNLPKDDNKLLTFLQSLPVEAFEKQYLSGRKSVSKFMPVLDFDLKLQSSGMAPEDVPLKSGIKILATLTNGEGDAFLYSFMGAQKCEALNSSGRKDWSLYDEIIANLFGKLLPESEQNISTRTEKIGGFYRNQDVHFSRVPTTQFNQCALAFGDFLNDYPLFKFLQYVLKNFPQNKIYMKLFDHVQSDDQIWDLRDRIPAYFNCSHGFEIPFLFQQFPRICSDSDVMVSRKTMEIVGSVCKMGSLSEKEVEDSFGPSLRMDSDNLKIETSHLSISNSVDKTNTGVYAENIYFKQDIIMFWDGISPICYQ